MAAGAALGQGRREAESLAEAGDLPRDGTEVGNSAALGPLAEAGDLPLAAAPQ